MQWRGRRTSRNIEDRRGSRGVRRAGGGFGLGALLLLAASIFFPDAVPLLRMVGMGDSGAGFVDHSGHSHSHAGAGINDEYREFIGVTLADTEDVWNQIFAQAGQRYPEPALVMFSGRTSSPCGPATTGSGPFYCPGDNRVYIDPAFYEIMNKRLGAPGDFAAAYVVAHEVAHHVQNVTGVIPKVDAQRRRVSKTEANRLTVRLELQADCYSGVWTHLIQKKKQILDEGDLEEALNAAFAIGDDTLQRKSGHVNPASFTHGTSQQRVNWFFKGLQTGNINVCDTFSQPYNQL